MFKAVRNSVDANQSGVTHVAACLYLNDSWTGFISFLSKPKPMGDRNLALWQGIREMNPTNAYVRMQETSWAFMAMEIFPRLVSVMQFQALHNVYL